MPLIEKGIQEPTVTTENETSLKDDFSHYFLKSNESSVNECSENKEH
jgi:hypothetical protein